MFSSKKDLFSLTAVELLHGYKNNLFTPSMVIASILKRIQQCNASVNAFNFVESEALLLEQAKEAEKRYANGTSRLLEGVPVSIKGMEHHQKYKFFYTKPA